MSLNCPAICCTRHCYPGRCYFVNYTAARSPDSQVSAFLKLFTSISPNTAAIHDNVTSNVISPMSLPTQRIVVEEDDFIIEVTCYNGDSSTTMFCSQAQFLQSAADPESFMNEPARWARPQVISYRLGAFVGQLKWFCERHGRSCSVHLWEAVREGLREKSERLRSQRSANAVLN